MYKVLSLPHSNESLDLTATTQHRCPMECNITDHPGPWSCTIKLRFDYDTSGDPLHHPKLVSFGPTITDPDKVEVMLRRAQAAVLAWPSQRVEEFLVMGEEEVRSVTNASGDEGGYRGQMFSKNVVCVDVRSEGGPNVTFVDLPGEVSLSMFVLEEPLTTSSKVWSRICLTCPRR
jgi:hypothetical protein